MLLMKEKNSQSQNLVDSLKQQKLVSDAEQHLLEQNFDGVGKYLFENQIASRQANKLYVMAAGCGPVIQGSHSDWKTWKTWKNGKAFSSQGKVREF